MILPILAYGHQRLRQRCANIDATFPALDGLIDDLWETMAHAGGCGLAASQIGKPARVFVVDSKTTFDSFDEHDRREYFDGDAGIRETFINAQITGHSDEWWWDDEGCLSIPGLTRKVHRPWAITIQYVDRAFQPQRKIYRGLTARMIQHEYDHTEGILYPDRLDKLAKKMMGGRLKKIAGGKATAKYPMTHP